MTLPLLLTLLSTLRVSRRGRLPVGWEICVAPSRFVGFEGRRFKLLGGFWSLLVTLVGVFGAALLGPFEGILGGSWGRLGGLFGNLGCNIGAGHSIARFPFSGMAVFLSFGQAILEPVLSQPRCSIHFGNIHCPPSLRHVWESHLGAIWPTFWASHFGTSFEPAKVQY